ncbi:MAG: RNA polymerase sigma factor [Candidatus Hinthialibacter sp.]
MDAAEAIYLNYIEPIKDRMKGCIYRIVQDPDDAADAFQNALFKIWNYLDRIEKHPNPHAYILSICVSSAHDLLRIRSRQSLHEMPLRPEIAAGFTPLFRPGYSNEILAIVQQAIASMSLKQAQAVFLRLFEDESYSVISQALDCTEETARSHVSKGLANLRSILLERNISMMEAYS